MVFQVWGPLRRVDAFGPAKFVQPLFSIFLAYQGLQNASVISLIHSLSMCSGFWDLSCSTIPILTITTSQTPDAGAEMALDETPTESHTGRLTADGQMTTRPLSAAERFFAVYTLRSEVYSLLRIRQLARLRCLGRAIREEVTPLCFHSVSIMHSSGHMWNVGIFLGPHMTSINGPALISTTATYPHHCMRQSGKSRRGFRLRPASCCIRRITPA